MGLDEFSVHRVSVRIVLILLTVIAMVWVLKYRYYITGTFFFLLLFAQLFPLVRSTFYHIKSVKIGNFSGNGGSGSGNPLSVLHYEDPLKEVKEEMDRLQAELEELNRTIHFYRVLLDYLDVGLLVLDAHMKIVYLNPTARRFLGWGTGLTLDGLRESHPEILEAITSLAPGNRRFIRLKTGGQSLTCLLYMTVVRHQGQYLRVVTLENLHQEIDTIEIEAWQRLIRVLTHEIMNSLTPIISLTETLLKRLNPDAGRISLQTSQKELYRALSAIHQRGEGLMTFVEKYRQVARLPNPRLQKVRVEHLFQRIIHLLDSEMKKHNIRCVVTVDPIHMEIRVDPDLFEQVLLNLVKNAIQAQVGRDSGKVEMMAYMDPRGRCIIQIRDEGPGIPSEVLDQIFVPFFTTREGGTGIGLTLSRQIVRRHGGTLTAQNHPDGGAVFTITL